MSNAAFDTGSFLNRPRVEARRRMVEHDDSLLSAIANAERRARRAEAVHAGLSAELDAAHAEIEILREQHSQDVVELAEQRDAHRRRATNRGAVALMVGCLSLLALAGTMGGEPSGLSGGDARAAAGPEAATQR